MSHSLRSRSMTSSWSTCIYTSYMYGTFKTTLTNKFGCGQQDRVKSLVRYRGNPYHLFTTFLASFHYHGRLTKLAFLSHRYPRFPILCATLVFTLGGRYRISCSNNWNSFITTWRAASNSEDTCMGKVWRWVQVQHADLRSNSWVRGLLSLPCYPNVHDNVQARRRGSTITWEDRHAWKRRLNCNSRLNLSAAPTFSTLATIILTTSTACHLKCCDVDWQLLLYLVLFLHY